MNWLRFGSVLHNPRTVILIAALALFLWSNGIALGSADFSDRPDIMLGVQDRVARSAVGVQASYSIIDELNGPADITLFVAEAVASRGEVMLAISGDDLSPAYVDGQQYLKSSGNARLAEDFATPYRIWEFGRTDNKASGWNYAFVYDGVTYYSRTVHVSGDLVNNKIWGYIDIDNDYYYSYDEPKSASGIDGAAEATPFAHHGRLVVTDDGVVLFTKIYNGNNGENEVITSGEPYLKINNVTVQPLADPDEDLVIQLCGGNQTWTLLKEYTPWEDVNHFGYYTDLGVGDDTTYIFVGDDDQGHNFYTSLAATTIGLWLFNDTDDDGNLDGSDSYLFSERSLTYNSGANEHQWFMVYDVSAYKGTGATYSFYSSTEDFTTTGDYNFLIYIDDDHTSSNFDHNDMILGINCPSAPPVATCPGDQDLFVCDLSEICIDGFACYDPDGDLQSCTVSPGTLNAGTVCFTPGGSGEYTIELIATDSQGSADTCETVVNVTLNSPPQANCPWGDRCDTTMFVCDLSPITISGFVCSDPDGNLATCQVNNGTLAGDDVTFTPVVGHNYIILTATDDCGATAACTVDVAVDLNDPPQITCPPDLTIGCDESTAPSHTGTATATDDHGPAPTITFSDTEVAGACPQEKVITRTWVATDECGATDECDQIITVVDDEDPIITCPANVIVDCNDPTDPASTGFATATDNCDPAPVVTHTDQQIANVITRTWTATDACGNSAQCVQTITIDDTTPPAITCPADVAVQCLANVPAVDIGSVTAVDDCDPDPTVIHVGDISDGNTCPEVITRTYRATDASGNFAECTQTITIDDTLAPAITCPADIFIDCDDSSDPAHTGTASATDNCDSSPGITYSDVETPGICPQEKIITRTWTATDDCGNISQCNQVITVEDNTAPVISCPANVVVDCNDPTVPAHTGTATASDNCDGSVDIIYSDNQVANVITRTWVATDDCGNVDQCQQTITIIDDTPPSIACPADVFVQCPDDVPPPDIGMVVASDDCDPAPVVVFMGDVSDGESCPEVITRTYRVTDASGNFNECEQLITIDDTIEPVISCPADITVGCGESTDPSHTGYATATDNCDPTPVITHTDQRQLEVIVRTWVATDACGNSAQCEQTITVEDDVDPVITCPPDLTIECDESTDPSHTGFASATDDCDPDPAIGYADSEVQGDCPQENVITRTWTATDESGNSAQCVQTITIEDTTDPTFTSCPGNLTVECDQSTAPSSTGMATATDNCDPAPVVTYADVLVDGSCPQEFVITRTWTATDACGNSVQCVQVINVEDTTDPIVTCPADAVVECNGPTDPSATGQATATDNCDDSPIVTHSDQQVGNVITRTWVATDACGNSAQCVQLITLAENNPPVATCPPNNTIQVDDFSEFCLPGFGWSDPDGNLATVVVEANGDPADTATGGQVCFVPLAGTNTIILTVTDECGETDECTTVLNIVINTCPELVFPEFGDTSLCIFENFCDTIEVIDPDGNFIEMSAEYGEFIPIIDEPGHWLGLYCFTVPDSACGEYYTYDVHVEASDGICTPAPSIHYVIAVLGVIEYSMDEEVPVIPGYTGEVGLYLDTHDCLCVGGLNASITWDASVLNLISVEPTANLDFGQEYLNINIGAFGPGTVQLLYIADINNQQEHGPLCEIDPNEPIFVFEFEVVPGEYPIDFVVPICYANQDVIYDNAVSDSSGYHVWFGNGCADPPDSSQFGTFLLDFRCGSIRILNQHDLRVGDLNFNGYSFEIGDVLVLANHLIDPDGYPFNLAQMWASDVNADSARATIADLIFMINVINGIQYNPKVGPLEGENPVEFIIDQDEPGQAKLILDTDFDIGGFLIDLPIPEGIDYRLSFNNDLGMEFRTYELPGLLRVCAYSLTANRIAAGETEILTIELPERNISVRPSAVSVSDASGSLATALTRQVAPLPVQFGITSCYPNPFNPTVSIEFALPAAAEVSLNIYDLAGRLVKEIAAGQFEAGYHQAIWNGESSAGEKVSSGIYFARLNAFGDNLTTSIQKLVMLK